MKERREQERKDLERKKTEMEKEKMREVVTARVKMFEKDNSEKQENETNTKIKITRRKGGHKEVGGVPGDRGNGSSKVVVTASTKPETKKTQFKFIENTPKEGNILKQTNVSSFRRGLQYFEDCRKPRFLPNQILLPSTRRSGDYGDGGGTEGMNIHHLTTLIWRGEGNDKL